MTDLSERSIYSVFAEMADERRDHTAVVYLGTRYSYSRVKELADAFASSLAGLGVTPGARVMLYIPNGIQWVAAWLGIQRLGAVAVPITPIYTSHDVIYIAKDSGAETILCADTNFGYVMNAQPETGSKQVIFSSMADLLPVWKRVFGYLSDVVPRGRTVCNGNSHSLGSLISGGRRNPLPELNERKGGDIAQILYTGGTTKFPKGVPIPHALFLVSSDEQIRMSSPVIAPHENVVLGNAPLYHIMGQTCGLATLFTGGTLVVQPRVNLDAAFDAVERFRVRSMIGVPTLYRMMLDHSRLDHYDLSSLEYCFCGGDALPVEIGRRWQDKFGRPIRQGYGATETCGGVSMCPVDVESPAKSVGKVLPSKKVKLVDPMSLKEVATGEPGELLVSSTHMVKAYLNKPKETEYSFVQIDGNTWYRTSDIMTMDSEGRLYFVDRTVDTIKYKGYRISASEVESALMEHPAVMSTCVVGVPDQKVGERIKACVVLKEDVKGITGYDLIKWCRTALASYKVPHHIEFRDMLPTSKVGKLLRREIREQERRRKDV